ncbi:MAG: MBL fold metallo-hydrolase [Verrucomicrobiota bacterium]
MKLTVLGSGSAGNATLIESDEGKFLVDVGFSGREMEKRLNLVGVGIREIQAILLTHEHIDHTKGLNILACKHGIPVFCNRLTSEYLKPKLSSFGRWNLFITGKPFRIGNLEIESFPIPHDAYDPVGFVFQRGQKRIGFLTDLGYATHAVKERMRKVDLMILEANYDGQLLREDTKRPWAVKQRIMARHGHLSNDGAAGLVEEVVTKRLNHLILGHLSEDCNRPDLAEGSIGNALRKRHASWVKLKTASQFEPSESIEL